MLHLMNKKQAEYRFADAPLHATGRARQRVSKRCLGVGLMRSRPSPPLPDPASRHPRATLLRATGQGPIELLPPGVEI